MPEQWQRDRCVCCAAEERLVRLPGSRPQHYIDGYHWNPCTAPTAEEYIAELERELRSEKTARLGNAEMSIVFQLELQTARAALALRTGCLKCRGKGTISVRPYGQTIYITDDADEIEMSYRDIPCPHCHPKAAP